MSHTYMYDATPKHNLAQFMKGLAKTEAELKKSFAYKNACNFKTVLLQMTIHILNSIKLYNVIRHVGYFTIELLGCNSKMGKN